MPDARVAVVRGSRRWREVDAPLRRFVAAAAGELGLDRERVGEIAVLLATDAQVRRLNRRFRGVDRTTDVLSFPPGDIAISLGAAGRQARAYGHAAATEVRLLALHGLLHLAGYDHEGDGGRMARREERLRRRWRLPAGLLGRAGSEHVGGPNRAQRARSQRRQG